MRFFTKYFLFITFLTILFCILVAFDTIPYLRGPAPYPPEWQWSYLFENTLSRIYAPLLCIAFLVGLFLWEEKNQWFSKKHPNVLLFLLIILCFLFQLSLLFFSRSGVFVLIHRIINPELNGYFTASLTIQNLADFLTHYNENVLTFVYHAKAHPPGAIMLFYLFKLIVAPFTFFIDIINAIHPNHADVKETWNTLLPLDKATAVFSAFFIPFISTLSLIPLYYSAKLLYGIKVATRSIFLFFLVPSLVFFIPINDAFLHLFSITAFFFLLKGLQKNHSISLIISGFILFLGVFFNLSVLPVLILFFVFAVVFLLNKHVTDMRTYIKGGAAFAIGFFSPILLLDLFLHFNFLQVIQTIMKHVPDIHTRSYPLWLYYNIHDFLIFCGIPIALVLITMFGQAFQNVRRRHWKEIDPVFLSLIIMIIILNFSGSVRGETGRLWSPYIPFVVLAATAFATEKIKLPRKLFAGFLLLMATQLLVMQEFWVMLW